VDVRIWHAACASVKCRSSSASTSAFYNFKYLHIRLSAIRILAVLPGYGHFGHMVTPPPISANNSGLSYSMGPGPQASVAPNISCIIFCLLK